MAESVVSQRDAYMAVLVERLRFETNLDACRFLVETIERNLDDQVVLIDEPDFEGREVPVPPPPAAEEEAVADQRRCWLPEAGAQQAPAEPPPAPAAVDVDAVHTTVTPSRPTGEVPPHLDVTLPPAPKPRTGPEKPYQVTHVQRTLESVAAKLYHLWDVDTHDLGQFTAWLKVKGWDNPPDVEEWKAFAGQQPNAPHSFTQACVLALRQARGPIKSFQIGERATAMMGDQRQRTEDLVDSSLMQRQKAYPQIQRTGRPREWIWQATGKSLED